MKTTINETIAMFLDWQGDSRQASPVTVANQQQDLKAFVKWVGIENVDELAPLVFSKYRKVEKDRGMADSTWNRMATSIRSWLRWMHGMQLISHPMYEAVPRVKEQGRPVEIVEKADVGAIERTLDGLQDSSLTKAYTNARLKLVWSLLIREGLRIGEVNRVNLADFKEEGGLPALEVHGKASRARIVHLNSRTWALTKAYLQKRESYLLNRGVVDTAEALFISTKLNRLSIRQIDDVVRNLAKLAGVEVTVACHKVRKTAVSRTVNGMLDKAALPAVAREFGHTIAVLEKYYLKPDGDRVVAAKEAAERLAA